MPANTMSDKELSELIYQPYNTTRRQDTLKNGATLRHNFFKELGADVIKQTMDEMIKKNGFTVYKKKKFLQELQKALSKKDEFNDFVFTIDIKEINDKLLQLEKAYSKKTDSYGLFAERLPQNIDIYANSINNEHPCFFSIMHSRQSKKGIDKLLSIYKKVVPNGTYCLLSFEKELPKAYNDLEVEIFLISDLLNITAEKAEKIIIV